MSSKTPKPLPSPPFDLEDEDDPYDYEADQYDPAEDCGLTADGYCMLAGSEWCDWACPFNR